MGAETPEKTGVTDITVTVRDDLLACAKKEELDISDLCNTALAYRFGMMYRVPKKGKSSRPHVPLSPVIIAPNASVPAGLARVRRPAAVSPTVINADDPHSPSTVIREKKARKAAPLLPPAPQPAVTPPERTPRNRPAVSESPAVMEPVAKDTGLTASPSHPKKSRVKSGKAAKKDDAVKTFFQARIDRVTEDSTDTVIEKDELYHRFERWCREQGYAKIPDRRTFSVALKNRFAVPERTVKGEPCWVSIRIR